MSRTAASVRWASVPSSPFPSLKRVAFSIANVPVPSRSISTELTLSRRSLRTEADFQIDAIYSTGLSHRILPGSVIAVTLRRVKVLDGHLSRQVFQLADRDRALQRELPLLRVAAAELDRHRPARLGGRRAPHHCHCDSRRRPNALPRTATAKQSS